jgi:hypothetical protein
VSTWKHLHCKVSKTAFINRKIITELFFFYRYEQDGEWYRAIIEKVESGRATVRYVDYGTRDWVQLDGIRLNVKFEEVPILALRCALHNIRVPSSATQPLGEKVPWPVKTLDILHEMVVEQEFLVTVIERYSSPMQVYLTSLSHSQSVTNELVNKGLAEFVEIVNSKKRRRQKKKKYFK